MTAETILALAKKYIGLKESPPNSNNVIFNTKYYGRAVNGGNYSWCCVFVWYLFQEAGASELFYGGQKTAYCPSVVAFAKKKNQWYTENFKPGDIIFFDWNDNAAPDHVGIVEKVINKTTVTTIEGNTAIGNDSNGGEVMRRTRYSKDIMGVYRPAYMEEDDMAKVIEQVAARAGCTPDEAITRLGLMVRFQDEVLDQYQRDGVQKLKELGFITVERDGRAQVNWGDLGTVIERLYEKTK